MAKEKKDIEDVSGDMFAVEMASINDRNFKEYKHHNSKYVKHEQNFDDLPEYLLELFEGSSQHGTLCKSIAEMVYGDGLVDSNGNEADGSIKQWLETEQFGSTGYETLKSAALDLKIFGGVFLEIIRGGDVLVIRRSNYRFWRIGNVNDNLEVESYYYSEEFPNDRNSGYIKNTAKATEYPAWKTGTTEPHSVYFMQLPKVNGKHYARPDYFHGCTDIELDKEISTLLLNHTLNGLSPTMVVGLNNGVPDDKAKKKAITKKFKDELTGPKGKKAIFYFANGKERSIEVTPIQYGDEHLQFQELGAQALRRVLTAHRVVNGIIFGIKEGQGFSNNADEMAMSIALFERNVIRGFREVLEYGFNKLFESEFELKEKLFFVSPEIDSLTGSQKKRADEVVEDIEDTTELSSAITCELTEDDDLQSLLPQLEEVSEEFDLDEWVEVYSEDLGVDDIENFELSRTIRDRVSDALVGAVKLFDKSSIKGDSRKVSSHDSGSFKVRYRYKHVPKKGRPKKRKAPKKSRGFCTEMMRLAKAGKVFRIEDINQMSFSGVNKKFGHKEQNYSLAKYKGGPFCEHIFERVIFYPRLGKNNSITERAAARRGFTPKPNPKEMGIAPRDMKNQGRHPNSVK